MGHISHMTESPITPSSPQPVCALHTPYVPSLTPICSQTFSSPLPTPHFYFLNLVLHSKLLNPPGGYIIKAERHSGAHTFTGLNILHFVSHIFFCIHCRGSYKSERTERTTRGAGDKRGAREKEKTAWNRDMRRYVEGRGMGWGYTG